uniref:Uncharacterized protein n=1 Tax=Chenopodium quinoa TaxID=63459 RepID=A0A803LEK2_CHEQI
MGVTSVINNGVQTIPLKFNKGFSTRISSSISLSSTHFLHPPSLLLPSVNSQQTHSLSVVYAKSTKEEDTTSTTSEQDEDSTQSYPSSNDRKSHLSTSAGSTIKEKDDKGSYMSSVRNVALCVSTAVAFGIGVGFTEGVGKATEFFAGKFRLIVIGGFGGGCMVKHVETGLVPGKNTWKYGWNRVLSYGIAGAIIFRLTLILLGTATLQRFEVVNLLLAAILLYSSFKLFTAEEEDEDLSDNFIVKTCQKVIPVTARYDGNRFFTIDNGVWKATPLLLTVAVIELSDIAFAVDSIPAVFGVTRDPFIVFSSNLFAILGFHVGTEVSLGFVATSLSTGVLLSFIKKSE